MNSQREAGMMCITGIQGVGKTYLNQHIIYDYTRDKVALKVRGRKCLIFDTNGEYTRDQFQKNGMDNFDAKVLALKDVSAWSKSPNVECRRIDAKSLGIAEKKSAIEYIMQYFKNGMLVLEDVNTYIQNVTHMEKIVSGLVSLRHRAVDVLISYQSLRPVEPRIWQNSRWIRMHYQADNVNDIKNKVNNPTMYKIAQYIVNNRYFDGDKRFYVYIHNFANQIEGDFTLQEFEKACQQYINANKKYLREYKEMNECTLPEAMNGLIKQYVSQYYGNN
jgi:KaiC/GvpD/RAD55 family RecA-like ATPase